MANPWFRFYTEFEDDPKVQMMSEAMQRRLAMLFCERGKGEKRTDAQRAFKWRLTPEQIAETKALFIENGFIDENWNLANWDKRQFLSDSSTERVRKHRAKKASETHETKCNGEDPFHEGEESPASTGLETAGNVTVTAPDADTDADTEQKQKETLAPSDEKPRSEPPVPPAPPKPEEPPPPPAPQVKKLGTLPLNDGTLFEITDVMVSQWRELYPAVDVVQECKSMKGWCIGNPTKLKTRRGILRFIVSWLEREQDRGGAKQLPLNGKGANANGRQADPDREANLKAITERRLAQFERRPA